ncbi:hypothetical protein [Krasilnikovia sp. M28-CT-15]|uniref:hypothetical protein n=1 Tax=Krasilnikovia sp. M28-CT-15 TaxID=3373540 RepID=UPI003875F931
MRGRAAWRAVGQAFPGPVGLATWIAVTVPAPLVIYEATHRWEEDQDVATALWWTLAAVPALAASAAARWTGRAGQHAVRPLLAATATGTLVSAVFLAGSMAFYRWVIPLSGAMDWPRLWWIGLLLAVAGAAIGYPIGRRRRTRQAGRWGYLGGALVAVAGALLAPVTVRLGAEDSTSRPHDEGRYGETGLYAAPPGRSGILELPAAGRYAILAAGFSPKDPACRVSGPGRAARRAELVSIPPSDYGNGDYATYAWVASFTVPGPGTYVVTCHTGDGQARYTVGTIPRIRGAVAAVIHWPAAVIRLLGSIPGLLIIATTYRRRARRVAAAAPE